ncbi:MAG: P1 family peptidase [Deltaproteobacteria bacterium]|nr:P1 family peptidase [Deltaproteobacteria bacterium]MCB9490357.1 P1 family peptidase [Deltaproteobacteria bacterium]
MPGQITDVSGILVGSTEDKRKMTGVTVVLCEGGATLALKTPGPATSLRQGDAARLEHLVDRAQAVCLTGGSAYGLGASSGVMRYLRERGVGHPVRGEVVPTVPTAVIFDILLGEGEERWPDPEMAYAACAAASRDVARGSAGAGCGATVGKILGPQFLMKGGQGTASRIGCEGLVVGALAVVNAYGDIYADGRLIAGARDPEAPTRLYHARDKLGRETLGGPPTPMENTTLVIVATNASFDKPALARVASMATAGMAHAISPAHCVFDGDALFALATGELPASGDMRLENAAGHLAAEAVAEAIADAVRHADGFGLIPDVSMLE